MPKHDHLRSLPIYERYPPVLWDTLNYAATIHENQYRKISGQPFITHPFGTMKLAHLATDRIETLQGALLHDTVETTPTTLRELERRFGARVADMVWGVTKDDRISDRTEQQQAYLDRLAYEAHIESVVIAEADKINNLEDILVHHALIGDAVWGHFTDEPDVQLWWYRSVHEIGEQRIPGCPLTIYLGAKVAELEQLLAERAAV